MALAASALGVAALAAGAPTLAAAGVPALPRGGCGVSFDPYRYFSPTLTACGLKILPRTTSRSLTEGGSSYEYSGAGILVRVLVPPAGFDPLRASDGRLEQYGLPRRPAGAAAQAAWRRQMSGWKAAAPVPPFLVEVPARGQTAAPAPTPSCGVRCRHRAGSAQAGIAGSVNWAGYVITGPRGTFTEAETSYREPGFYGSQCRTNSAVTWTGIGGWSSGDLAQDGTSFHVTGMANHQAWFEVVPRQSMIPVNFYGTQGYLFYASTRWMGNRYRFYMYNYYSGTSYAADEYVSSAYYTGDSVESIVERPSIGGRYTNLSNFGTLSFSNGRANTVGFGTWAANGRGRAVQMIDSSAYAMATSTFGGGGTSATQHRCY